MEKGGDSMTFDYQIAVPSYGRENAIQLKTLRMLDDMKVDRDRVLVVCANYDEKERYDTALHNDWKTAVAEIGIANARRWYHNHFPAGSRILSIDDDVQQINQKKDEKLVPYEGSIDDFAYDGFSQCEAAGAKLWSVYPVQNGMFMNDHTVIGLRFISGGVFGSYAGDSVFNVIRNSSGEDLENTLRSFTQHGKVVRLEYLGMKTHIWSGDGGMQKALGGLTERLKDNEAALIDIHNRFPSLTSLYRKAGNILNIRFKHVTHMKIPKESRQEFVNAATRQR